LVGANLCVNGQTRLTSTCHTSHRLIIAVGLTDNDSGPLGSGRPSKGWKYHYRLIATFSG